jgi:hypothetical protein
MLIADEYTLEQQITLLNQHYSALNDLLTDLNAQIKRCTDSQQGKDLQEQIDNLQAELTDIERELAKLKAGDAEATLGTLYNIPSLPSYLVEHTQLLNELKAKLVMKPSIAEVSDGQKNPILLRGASGIGKSLVSAVLAHDLVIRRKFVDGIFWIHVGQASDPVAQQMRVYQYLAKNTSNPTAAEFLELEEGVERLKELCSKRACLFILDDVWDVRDVLAFSRLGKECQLIMSTCENNVIEFIKHFLAGIQEYTVPYLNMAQATSFFSHYLETSSFNSTQHELLNYCNYVPQTLKLAAHAVRSLPANTPVQKHLQQAEIFFPEVSYEYSNTLLQALHVNSEALGEQSEYYFTLAVFADYTAIPYAPLLMLWRYLYQLQDEESHQFIKQLVAKGLVQITGDSTSKSRYLSLQTIQHDYLCECADVEKLHSHLLAAYRRLCPHGWATGVQDGYFFDYLAIHLLSAQRQRELKSLLLDFDWIQAKLQYCTLHSLLNDYSLLEDDADVVVVQKALRQNASVLLQDKQQLATQLLNCLWVAKSSPELHTLLNQAKELAPDWLPPQ